MGNLKINADTHKNRLYFNFVGVVTQKRMEELYTDVRFCVADLKPGFDVISDFSACELIHLDSIPALKKMMSYMIENGLGEIVRILQSDKISHRQVLNLATRVQGYKPIYVSDIDEAEDVLKKTVKRKGLRVHLHKVPVRYIVGNEEESGHIINMSTSGCAVEFTTLRPETDTFILIKDIFPREGDSPESFEIKAKVVRVDNDVFAVEFTELDDEKEELLWKHLLAESRR